MKEIYRTDLTIGNTTADYIYNQPFQEVTKNNASKMNLKAYFET